LLSLLDNDVDDANSAIAGAARNYRPARRRRRRRAVFNFQGRTLTIFFLCNVRIENEFFIHLVSWNRRLPFVISSCFYF
jgi:hypothetical protein